MMAPGPASPDWPATRARAFMGKSLEPEKTGFHSRSRPLISTVGIPGVILRSEQYQKDLTF